MMITRVYKYNLDGLPKQIVSLPVGSKILSVGVQEKTSIRVWVEVPVEPTEMYDQVFYDVPTGYTVPQDAEFVGTCLLYDGVYVQHIYKEVRSEK